MKQEKFSDKNDEYLYGKAIECVKLLDGKKAENTILIDMKKVNSYFNYFIITTGNSIIHNKAIYKELKKHFSDSDINLLNKPDHDSPWIIMDYNDLVIHVFTSEMRDYYQLEKLWSDAPVLYKG
jgi:ribosome-associated protein